MYGCSINTISSAITKLVNAGYLIREIIYKEGTKEVDKRILKLPVQETHTSHENLLGGTPKNLEDNNTSNNKESNISISKPITNTPTNITKERKNKKESRSITIEQGKEIAKDIFEKNGVEDIDAFLILIEAWLVYKKERGEHYVPIGFKAIVKKLLRFCNKDFSVASEIIETAITSNWHTFYELKPKYR